jgi:ubiquinone/menaquinone biosynthesis C-methylase UbiE
MTRPDLKTVKKEYYERPKIVGDYDRWRFGGPSGQWIKQAEENAVAELLETAVLPLDGVGLDVPTGTGRMIPVLRQKLPRVIACDISAPMLQASAKYGADRYLLSDATRLDLSSASVDLVLSSRFYFHYQEIRDYLAEAARVLKPGGYLLFDAYNWTPRTLIPGRQRRLGGRVFTHSRSLIERQAVQCGLSLVATKGVFVITPFVYQYLPLMIVRTIEHFGDFLLKGIKSKTYYLLRKS